MYPKTCECGYTESAEPWMHAPGCPKHRPDHIALIKSACKTLLLADHLGDAHDAGVRMATAIGLKSKYEAYLDKDFDALDAFEDGR